MAKQNGGMPNIDEDFMKELISQGVPSKQDNNKTNDAPQETQIQSPNQKIPDRKTKCVIKTHINIKQNVIFGAKLKPV